MKRVHVTKVQNQFSSQTAGMVQSSNCFYNFDIYIHILCCIINTLFWYLDHTFWFFSFFAEEYLKINQRMIEHLYNNSDFAKVNTESSNEFHNLYIYFMPSSFIIQHEHRLEMRKNFYSKFEKNFQE